MVIVLEGSLPSTVGVVGRSVHDSQVNLMKDVRWKLMRMVGLSVYLEVEYALRVERSAYMLLQKTLLTSHREVTCPYGTSKEGGGIAYPTITLQQLCARVR